MLDHFSHSELAYELGGRPLITAAPS